MEFNVFMLCFSRPIIQIVDRNGTAEQESKDLEAKLSRELHESRVLLRSIWIGESA